MKKILMLVVVSLVFFGFQSTTWRGFLYPNKNFLLEYVDVGVFRYLPSCRSAIMKEVERRRLRLADIDYECGWNCKISRYGTGYVCDRTVR